RGAEEERAVADRVQVEVLTVCAGTQGDQAGRLAILCIGAGDGRQGAVVADVQRGQSGRAAAHVHGRAGACEVRGGIELEDAARLDEDAAAQDRGRGREDQRTRVDARVARVRIGAVELQEAEAGLGYAVGIPTVRDGAEDGDGGARG